MPNYTDSVQENVKGTSAGNQEKIPTLKETPLTLIDAV